MKKFALVASAGLISALFAVPPVQAQGDFSPEMVFELSDTKVGANPSMNIVVSQDDAEEELQHVTLKIPAGFNLPADEDIANNTELGNGEIVIDVGPGCRKDALGAGPTSASPPLPATLVERDRTDEQADRGVVAVWVLDVRATTVTLEITGSATTGWTLDGDVPPNDNTCPPFNLDLTVNATAGDVPILTNPAKAKKKGYKFSGTFTSLDSPAMVTITQKIKITK